MYNKDRKTNKGDFYMNGMKKINCTAIIPDYNTLGANITYYFLEDGTKVPYDFPIKYFITDIFRTRYINPTMRRYWVQEVLHMKTYLPLFLDSDTIFIPIKIRTQIPLHDGSLGFVLVSAIAEYTDFKIILHNGTVIHTLSSRPYISKKLREADLLKYTYKELSLQHDPLGHSA